MTSPSPSTQDRIKDAISGVPSPTRAELVKRQRRLALGAFALLSGTALMHGGHTITDKPLAYVLTVGLCMAAAAAVATRTLGRFASSPLGPPRDQLRSLIVLTVPALSLGVLAAAVAAPETLSWPVAKIGSHLVCPILHLVSGGLVAVLGLSALRRADPISPRTTAMAVGAAAGAWATLAVTLNCKFDDPGHVFVTHVLPVIALMLATAHWGARWVGIGDKTH